MNEKLSKNHSVELELCREAYRQEIIARIKFEKGQYDEAIEYYQNSLNILRIYDDGKEMNDKTSKIMNIYWKICETYEEIAKQTNSWEPIKYAIAALTKLLQYRPYDRNIRLKRSALWKIVQNCENALTDALVYFCTELSKDCLDVPLENINEVLSNDLKQLINDEYDHIDSYAQSLKPFLTQDFINLWLACDCDDPLVEDIWNVRNEQLDKLPSDIAPLQDSQYKEALKALSNGELSSVIQILEEASISGKYRLEATLLLALAYTRDDGAIVDKYLDRFERIWDQKPAGYNVRRCKQLVVRYVSISRAIRYNPFSGKKLENETKEVVANLYFQEALVIFWRRENSDFGEVFWKKEWKNDNRRKLQHIQKLCDLALLAKPDFHNAKILKLRSILELQMAVRISLLADDDLKPLENLVNKTNETVPTYNAFGDLCLYSIYLANSKTDQAKLCCERMLETLFFYGQPLAFLIRYDWDIDRTQTLARLEMLLAKEPENYLAHILMYYYHFKHGELNCALTHADRTLKYWPYHMNTDNLAIHVREYVHCRLLHAVQQELDETVEASFRMIASLSLPTFGELQKSQMVLENSEQKLSSVTNTSESEKAINESEKATEIANKSEAEQTSESEKAIKITNTSESEIATEIANISEAEEAIKIANTSEFEEVTEMASTSAAEKATKIENMSKAKKPNHDLFEMEQFYHKLEAIAQQECEISVISTEKDKDSKICGTETASTSNARLFGKSGNFNDFAALEEKTENAKKMISATFVYAEQVRRQMERGIRTKKDKRRIEDVKDAKNSSLKQTLKCVVSDEKKLENGEDSDTINQFTTNIVQCPEEEQNK